MVRSTCIALMAITVLAIIFTVSSDSLEQDLPDLQNLSERQKRPFCNAFTGCGRKRSYKKENGYLINSKQNRLYAVLLQKMAEVEALRGIIDETQK